MSETPVTMDTARQHLNKTARQALEIYDGFPEGTPTLKRMAAFYAFYDGCKNHPGTRHITRPDGGPRTPLQDIVWGGFNESREMFYRAMVGFDVD